MYSKHEEKNHFHLPLILVSYKVQLFDSENLANLKRPREYQQTPSPKTKTQARPSISR